MKNEVKKGDEISFNFHGFGLVSKELADVYKVTKDYIQIEAEDEEFMYKFCRKTGKCLNDNKYMGCYRTLSKKYLF